MGSGPRRCACNPWPARHRFDLLLSPGPRARRRPPQVREALLAAASRDKIADAKMLPGTPNLSLYTPPLTERAARAALPPAAESAPKAAADAEPAVAKLSGPVPAGHAVPHVDSATGSIEAAHQDAGARRRRR